MNKLKTLKTAKHVRLYGLFAVLGLSLLLGSLLVSNSHAAAPAPPSFYLNPANQSLASGTAFTVEVHENSGINSVNAVQANLSYPTANLTLSSIDYSTSAFSLQAQSVGASGVINIARGQPGGVSGDQIVAVLHFTATANGTANIAFTTGTGMASSSTNTNILPGLSSTAGDSVIIAAQPTVSLSANPTTISSGQSSTLTWTSANTTSCSATTPSGWTSSTATSGTQSVSPTTTTTYTISCTGTGGTVQANATVIIPGSLGLDKNLGSGNWNGNGGSFTTTAAASAATRVVVTVSYWNGSGGTVSAVTVGGANATLDKRTTNGSDFYEIWSIPETSGLASGSTIAATLPGGIGGVLIGAMSINGVDLTNGGGVAATASATGTGTSFSSGTVTSPGGIVIGGAGNETAATTTASLTTGTKVHDAWNSGSQQGFTDGYIIGGTNIAGTFSTSSTANTGAAVAYKAISGGNPSPTATLTANPTTITSGSSSTLTWSSTNATSCSATAPSGFSISGTSGTQSVSPTATTTYNISCTGAGGTATASATVTVGSGTVTGDLNNDGHVNAFDLSIFLNHWQQTGTSLPEDFNNDSIVNVFDLSILLSNWGK